MEGTEDLFGCILLFEVSHRATRITCARELHKGMNSRRRVIHWAPSLETGCHTLCNIYLPLVQSPGKILFSSALGHLLTPWTGTGPRCEVWWASFGCRGVQGTLITRVLWNGGCASVHSCWEFWITKFSVWPPQWPLEFACTLSLLFPYLQNGESTYLIRLCGDWIN